MPENSEISLKVSPIKISFNMEKSVRQLVTTKTNGTVATQMDLIF